MSDALTLTNVSKLFGSQIAVANLNAGIPESCIYGFLGPNGAGKTTTIRMIMSILYPDSGEINILGHAKPEEVKDRIGYLPEEKGLYKKMKPLELVSYFGQLKGMSPGNAKRAGKKLLEEFKLGNHLQKTCESLSKGMGQKVQIAATLVHDPDIVILDEPFSGLDPINIELVREVILKLKKSGKTVIFSTHIMEQAEQICDYVMLFNKGSKILDGKIGDIKQGFAQSVRIEYSGDISFLEKHHGVVRINDMGNKAEVTLDPNFTPQNLVRDLVGRGTQLTHFSVTQASLHEIFVRAVKDSDE